VEVHVPDVVVTVSHHGTLAVLDHAWQGLDMAVVWEQIVIDAQHPQSLARWWAEALGWIVTVDDDDEVEIRASADALPGLLFVRVTDARVVKNRLHLDLRPDDQNAEVARLVARGARRIDVGQGDVSWVVLADPEGNELCVLSSRREPG
jgi:hypothetical protein